jgi:hypothetical protein
VSNELQSDVKKTAEQLLSTEEGRQILLNLHAQQQKQASQEEVVDVATNILLNALKSVR